MANAILFNEPTNHYTENDGAKTKRAAKILHPNEEKQAIVRKGKRAQNGKRISFRWEIIVKIIYYQPQKF